MRRPGAGRRGGVRACGLPLGLAQLSAMVGAMGWAHRFVMGQASTSGGDVVTVPNIGGAGGALAVAAGTLAAPAADAKLNNQLSITFGGSQRLQSSLAASAWRFLHDGTGHEIWTVYSTNNGASTQSPWSTRTEFGGDIGASMLVRSAQTSWDTTNAGGAIINTNSGVVTQNAAQSNYFTFKSGNSPEWIVVHNGVAVNSGSAASPSVGVDPSGPLNVGGTTAGILLWSGSIAEILVSTSPLDPSQRAAVSRYITLAYGAPA